MHTSKMPGVPFPLLQDKDNQSVPILEFDSLLIENQNTTMASSIETGENTETFSPPLPPPLEPELPSLPEEMICAILKKLSPENVLRARLCNHTWNNAFNSPRIRKRFEYFVDGWSPNNIKSSLQTLLDSSIRWDHISFGSVDLEQELLGEEIGFVYFTRKFGPTLQTLTLAHSHLPMGRFIELMVFCDTIKKLVILDTPSVFHSGFEITYWAIFFEKFFQRLRDLQELDITECSGALTEKTLLSWLAKTKSLKSLRVHSGKRTMHVLFPKEAIAHAFRTNAKTLKTLDIEGRSGPADESLWDIINKSPPSTYVLESLKTEFVKLGPGFGNFLKQVKKLKSLSIMKSCIAGDSFHGIGNILPALQKVEIIMCQIYPYVITGLKKIRTLKSVTFIGNTSSEKNVSQDVEDGYKSSALIDKYMEFFRSYTGPLEEITFSELEGAKVLSSILKPRPSLRYLNISGTMGIYKYHLESLKTVKSTLKTLIMSECNVDDNCFTGHPSGLTGMTALEVLDLSKTGIGNSTVLEWVAKCENLTTLNVIDTYVTTDSHHVLPINCYVMY